MEAGSMAISFACGCGKLLKARDELAGKKAKCPDCGTVLEIPRPAPAANLEDVAAGALQESTPAPAARRPVPDDVGSYGLAEPDRTPASATDDETALRPARSTYQPAPASAPRREAERPAAAKAFAAAPKPKASAESGASLLEYSYLLLVFALIPLMFSLLGKAERMDIADRIDKTLEKATPEQQGRALSVLSKGEVSIDEAIDAMPDGKLDGAHLPRNTYVHWVYAGIATAAFLLLITSFFTVERVNPVHLLLIGLFTGTVGIIFLLAVQLCAQLRIGRIRGRGWFMLIVLILAGIGWSYRSALDDDSNFFLSALGFTMGVGLCEEFTKAIPLFFYFKRHAQMGWRGACLWGLASGIGFGVSEGVTYSADMYNGISGVDIYIVRFISCVALHAMWSASVGIAIARNVDDYEAVEDAAGFGIFMLRMLAVPMVLHGFYDTLLKKDMNGWALLVAVASFGWLALQIELARGWHPHAGRPKRGKLAY
jgi:RsiW-degrading membrane proteinase PrsW (M82 family)